MNLLDAVDLFERNATISFFTFANSIMPAIYKFIFGSTMPRISEDLNFLLQNPVELIGDWFCYKNFTVIRVYGFEGEPYKLTKFTTRTLFALEFLRQRLIVENDNFLKYKKASSMNFNFTLEPFVARSVYAITVVDQILKSESFQTDRSLRYDPKKVFHQRRLDMNLKGYDVEQDEVLIALANIDLLEPIEEGDRNSSSSERNNPNKATKNQQAEVPTPLKGDKSLKRHSTDTVDMDVDVATKKPRIFIQDREIVDLEDDDERSINKGKATIVEEEPNEHSQSMSNTKRLTSHLAMVETIEEPAITFQRFALDEAETSQFHSREELVRDFTNERNKSTNDNYKLMQEIRKTILVESYLLAVREAYNNVFRIVTDDKEMISQVRIQMDKVGILDKIKFHKQDSDILYSD